MTPDADRPAARKPDPDPSVKDPEGDAAIPAAMPPGGGGGANRSNRNDPAGQQGGTHGGGKDRAAV